MKGWKHAGPRFIVVVRYDCPPVGSHVGDHEVEPCYETVKERSGRFTLLQAGSDGRARTRTAGLPFGAASDGANAGRTFRNRNAATATRRVGADSVYGRPLIEIGPGRGRVRFPRSPYRTDPDSPKLSRGRSAVRFGPLWFSPSPWGLAGR